jgi:hypothetical protein
MRERVDAKVDGVKIVRDKACTVFARPQKSRR